MTDDEVVDAEIVDDTPEGELARLVPPDTILTPCHHGCGCGLHQQTLYGERVPVHEPADLDHGEMGLLVKAAADAAHLMNDFHDHLRKLREGATLTYGQACRALLELTKLLDSDATGKARAERDRIDAAYAGLSPVERQPAPHWLKAATIIAVACVAVFDAYFFQQTFLNILQVAVGDPWWKQDIGLAAALVLAIGLIAAGRILAGPVWRIGHRWRRAASPDAEPPGRVILLGRILAIGAAPAATFFILGWWASLRGQAAAAAQRTGTTSLIPNGFSVMLLLLSMSLTVIVLEVLVHNPYQADRRRADRALAKLHKKITARSDAVSDALSEHETAWRDLRSARDEIISFVLAELGRPWHTVILPARLRHGKAGPAAATPKYDVKIEMGTMTAGNGGITGADHVTITYQIFEGVTQPQPGPGPLAEVVRAVIDLDPQALRTRQSRLEQSLHAQLDGGAKADGDGRVDDASPEAGR
jgi:hypothetical protein